MQAPSLPPLRRAAAFTLIELLITLAVASLLLALAAPSWQRQFAGAELRGRAEALTQAMARARSEAIARGARVDVCPSYDRQGCAADGRWEAGWLAFVNDAAADTPAQSGDVLDRDRGSAPDITIRGNSPVARYVSYTPLGHARRHDGALQMGTFTLCRRGHDALKVVLANSGRARIDVTSEACP